MKAKLQKQFLPADDAMELYERFDSLKQKGMSVEEYTSEFNNLPIRVCINETNEQMTSHYLAGLNQSIRHEWEWFVCLILKMLDNMPLWQKKRMLRYGVRRPL
jgi:hypothetical protein